MQVWILTGREKEGRERWGCWFLGGGELDFEWFYVLRFDNLSSVSLALALVVCCSEVRVGSRRTKGV